MKKSADKAQRRDLQMAALAASVTIVSFFLVYWFIQILDTLAMLELAYG